MAVCRRTGGHVIRLCTMRRHCTARRVLILGIVCIAVYIVVHFCSFLGLFTHVWAKCNTAAKQDNNFYRDPDQSQDDEMHYHQRGAQSYQQDVDNKDGSLEDIDCVINDQYSIPCKHGEDETYMPFSFLEKYFEVYGSMQRYQDGSSKFEFRHSYSEVFLPSEPYDPRGVFMSFEHYNVEVRNRVKCISGMEGVPLSTQWGPQGYHYPIQIAQFGLSHYSKYLVMDHEPSSNLIENGNDEEGLTKWILPDSKSAVKIVRDQSTENSVIGFTSSELLKNPGITIALDETQDFVLSMDIKFVSNGSLTVTVEAGDNKMYHIHYLCSDSLISISDEDIFYGLGSSMEKWKSITRDVSIDLHKGLGLRSTKGKKGKNKNSLMALRKISSLSVRGHGFLDNLTLSDTAHLRQFYDAARWLVNHQDDKGGWAIMVTRRLIPNVLELAPGWYSAMAQGQAMSLLVRAYLHSDDPQFLEAAIRALLLFNISSKDGGIVAKFAKAYTWYEEYPTTPSSYVLNGFIFSLLGLYDVKSAAQGRSALIARQYYDRGMKTLKALLLLFDTGSGTLYDLRHLALGIGPNRARWDYHTTHINQLLLLASIDKDPLFKTTADRWIGYMKGQRAHHN